MKSKEMMSVGRSQVESAAVSIHYLPIWVVPNSDITTVTTWGYKLDTHSAADTIP